MRIPRIYTPLPLHGASEVELDPRASHYLGQVLRMKPGRELRLFNGDGYSYSAQIIAASKKSLRCQLDRPNEPAETESSLAIELGIAISKGDRLDFVMQKATELGVSKITPLLTERVDVRLDRERQEKKQQHWQQVMISACEQCGRNRLVEMASLQPLATWLPDTRAELKLVLSPAASNPLASAATPASVALLIGPEGGLTDDEVTTSLAAGFAALRLGPRILRTETAPLAAISILQYRWGDLG